MKKNNVSNITIPEKAKDSSVEQIIRQVPDESVNQDIAEDSKATIDGWWLVSGGVGHVEIVVAETEEDAIVMFRSMLRITEGVIEAKPLDRVPVAGTDAIFYHPTDRHLCRGGVQMLASWCILTGKALPEG